jgi:hypothetical protein
MKACYCEVSLIALLALSLGGERSDITPAITIWRWAIYLCDAGSGDCGRGLAPGDHDVSHLLAAMRRGDVVIAFFERYCIRAALPIEEVLALRVTFAAKDAELRRVAEALKACDRRIRFTPIAPHELVTLRVEAVTVGDLLRALAENGLGMAGSTSTPKPGRALQLRQCAPL